MALKRLFLCFDYVFLCFLTQLLALLCGLCCVFVVFEIKKATTLEALRRDLCDLVVGFTSTCLVASRFALDHGVLQRGGHRSLCLSDLQTRRLKEG